MMNVELKNIDKKFNLRWIPISERLPEPGVSVLACLIDHRRRKVSEYGGKYKTSIRIDKIVFYSGDEPFWSKGNTPSIIAWMPLPEPPTVVRPK